MITEKETLTVYHNEKWWAGSATYDIHTEEWTKDTNAAIMLLFSPYPERKFIGAAAKSSDDDFFLPADELEIGVNLLLGNYNLADLGNDIAQNCHGHAEVDEGANASEARAWMRKYIDKYCKE